MNKKMIRSFLAIVCIIMFLITSAKEWSHSNQIEKLQSDSEFKVIYDEYVPMCEIRDSDWFVIDDKIYVLFEDYSYVNVYSIRGKFLYSIQTYHMRNGATRIAYKDGLFVIYTRSGGVYLFDGSEKKEYISGDRDNETNMERTRAYFNYIEYEFNAKRINQEANYKLKRNTILHLNSEGEYEQVLSFPNQLSGFSQVYLIVLVVCLILFILLKE